MIVQRVSITDRYQRPEWVKFRVWTYQYHEVLPKLHTSRETPYGVTTNGGVRRTKPIFAGHDEAPSASQETDYDGFGLEAGREKQSQSRLATTGSGRGFAK
jgi:hypothetical protein